MEPYVGLYIRLGLMRVSMARVARLGQYHGVFITALFVFIINALTACSR